jgi:hypothetical protein
MYCLRSDTTPCNIHAPQTMRRLETSLDSRRGLCREPLLDEVTVCKFR